MKIMVWLVSAFIILFGSYGFMYEDAGVVGIGVIIAGIIVSLVGNKRINQRFPK
jgi:hypothetical protein